jgi:enoyl-CoA hydratase
MNIERSGEVAVLRMNAGKANAISGTFLAQLGAQLDALGDARALVITGYQSFFSGGLDLPALLSLDPAQMSAFIDAFGASMLRVFELPLPVIAAVNGHAVAGGCVLALQADQRLMADGNARIGLNEVTLGIGLPTVVVETLRCQVPSPSLRPIALEGRMLLAREALQLGLVDEVVAPAELEQRAVARARELGSLPRGAYAQIKAALRRPASEAARRDTGAETASWVATWFSEGGQERIRSAVEKLARKKG